MTNKELRAHLAKFHVGLYSMTWNGEFRFLLGDLSKETSFYGARLSHVINNTLSKTDVETFSKFFVKLFQINFIDTISYQDQHDLEKRYPALVDFHKRIRDQVHEILEKKQEFIQKAIRQTVAEDSVEFITYILKKYRIDPFELEDMISTIIREKIVYGIMNE